MYVHIHIYKTSVKPARHHWLADNEHTTFRFSFSFVRLCVVAGICLCSILTATKVHTSAINVIKVSQPLLEHSSCTIHYSEKQVLPLPS